MAKFNIRRSKRTLPAVGPSVTADLDVRTVGTGRGIAQAGESLMDLGLRLDVLEGKAQSDIATRDARLSYVDMINEIRQEDDVSKWDTAFDAHIKRTNQLTPKNRRGARQYKSMLDQLYPVWTDRYMSFKSAKLEDNMVAASEQKITDLRLSANINTMDKVILDIKTELEVRDRLSPSISRTETEQLKERVARDVQMSVAEKIALDNPEAILGVIQGSKIEGFDEIKNASDVIRISNIARATIAEKLRQDTLQKKENRRQTMAQMLADFWDGKLKDPQDVTDALRMDNLDDTDAKYLREAMLNPDPPKTTNEAIIAVRYAIDGIGMGTESREGALKEVIKYSSQLSPADGKSFIKEIFGEHDTKNAFWKREAWDYIEKQILESAPLTGILVGSAKQRALSAKAHLAFEKALQDAAKEGKPLNGKELLIKAHEIMIPFRKQSQPKEGEVKVSNILSGGTVPQSIGEIRNEKGKIIATEKGQIPEESPFGLEDIWNEMSDADKSGAMRLLFEGVAASELVEHYKKKHE